MSWYKEMYQDSIGIVADNYYKLFVNAKKSISFTQEFGTVASIEVYKGVATESQIFVNAMNISDEEYNKRKEYYDERRKDCTRVFYLSNSVFWKRKILQNGTNVFDTAVNVKK